MTISRFKLNNETFVTNEKNTYFGKIDANGKTHKLKKEVYDAAAADPAAVFIKAPDAPDNKQAPDDNKQAPEAPKAERKPKGQRFDDEAKAVILAPIAKEYTIKEDARGRIAYMQDKKKIVGIQPAKDHYTVYISKHLLATPDQVIAALKDTFKLNANDVVVNPTYIINKGHDSFSVKATVCTTPDKLDKLVDLLIVKNNEVAKA